MRRHLYSSTATVFDSKTFIMDRGCIQQSRGLGASLTACKVLNKLAGIVKEIANEKSAELESWARMYRTIATAITSLCFKKDANYTRQLVLHRRPQWGNQSFLVISSFLEGDESESFRIVLDDLWTGRLISHRFLTIKLILAIFPPLAIFLRMHKKETSSYNLPARWRAYYTAPITKFLYNAMFFVFHLLAFSYFLMADFHHGSHWYTTSMWEKLVTLWVFGLLVEELRQMITTLTGNGIFDRFSKALEVLRSGWNGVDWIMLLLYVCGFIVRSTIDEERFYIARVLYTLSLLAMYIRFLRFATIWKYLGPKVEMIRLMMIRDLPPFLLIFVVYFISFGIAYRVLLFPNGVFSVDAVLSVFTVPFWQTFGEIQTEMTEGTPGCTRNITLANSNPNIERCPETQGYPLLVPILSGIFIIMSNILLLNILIAVFNQTYGSVGQESTTVHRGYQYSLVEEYIARPVLPPPLNMLEILIIRPLATLAICLYWSHERQEFRWGNHCWPLFKLLMAGKEADPKLWKRVSEAVKRKESTSQQSEGSANTQMKNEITKEQIETIFKIARNGSNIQMVNQTS